MKPETCHFEKGTCREPEWGEKNCFIPHYVYLANTSGLKVGITRHSQIPTRWIDQGATQALPIFKVSTRLYSGLVETALARFIADKTNWRAMLKGKPEDVNLKQQAEELKPLISDALANIRLQYGQDSVLELDSGMRVMISEFFNEDDPDVDHSLGQKVAITWVESWEVVLADEQEV